MDAPHPWRLHYIAYFILFIPVFIIHFALGFAKAAIFSPFVFLVIAFGDSVVVIGLWPLHLIWTAYCIFKSKKFGPYLKFLMILLLPIPIALWTVVGVLGSVVMGIFYAFIWPVMETFKAISKPGLHNKLFGCIMDGTWSNVWGACTIVRDFVDFYFHSYFSMMDEWLEAKDNEKPLELKVTLVPGCILAAILGVSFDLPMFALIVIYKAPLMLIKGWQRLVEDLVGRSGPFLEAVCVPFAGLLILLWPFAVVLAVLAGIFSSFGYGCYATVVAYQENSTKKGLLYVIASVSLFDEYTNDFLYMREGSCFPRPQYRAKLDQNSQLLPQKGLHEQLEVIHAKRPMMANTTEKIKSVKAVTVWDYFFKGSELTGKELIRDGAIGIQDLEHWQHSKNKIVNIGIPAYTFLQCFLQSIKSGSTGLLMSDSVEVTDLNRPEGRVFDWLYEPRLDFWHNGGVPPEDDIKKAQLEAISRRLQGFCLTLSRRPTFRRRLSDVVSALMQDALQQLGEGTKVYGSAMV